MLHDFLLALLGIEGDLIQLDAKSKTLFQLTSLARRHLHAAEVSLIEATLLTVATQAATLRRFSESIPQTPFRTAFRELITADLQEFAYFVQQLEGDLIRVPSLSVAFLSRKLQPWGTRFSESLEILQALDLEECRAVDTLLSSDKSGNSSEFQSACLSIVGRLALSTCVYGEVVCDIQLSSFPRLFSAEILVAADFCLTGINFLKENDAFQVELAQLWPKTISSVREVSKAILATKQTISEKLKKEFLAVFLGDFRNICDLYLLQDGYFWQSLFDQGDVLKNFQTNSNRAALQVLATSFSFSTEFGNSALLVLDRGCRLLRGPSLEFCAAGGRATVQGREFALHRFPGFRLTVVLSRLGNAGHLRTEVRAGDYVQSLTVKNEAGEYIITVGDNLEGIWKGGKLPVLVQWVRKEKGMEVLIDGESVEVPSDFERVAMRGCEISISGSDGAVSDWRFEAMGVSAELERFAVFDKVSKFYNLEVEISSITKYLVMSESLMVYNSIFRYLYGFKKVLHEISRVPLSQHNVYVYTAKKAVYDICVFLFRDILAHEITLFIQEVSKTDFLSIRNIHSAFLARLITRLFMRQVSVLTALSSLLEVVKKNSLHKFSEQAFRDLQGAKRRLCAALREALQTPGYPHAVLLEAVFAENS